MIRRRYGKSPISMNIFLCSHNNNAYQSVTVPGASATTGASSYNVQLRCIAKGHSSSSDVTPAVLHEIRRSIKEHSDKTLAAYNQRNHIRNLIDFYATMKLIDVDLNKIVIWMDNPNYDPYIFSHRQLPILLAHLVRSLEMLPGGLSSMSNITATKLLLIESFTKLLEQPIPTTTATEKALADVLEELDSKHSEFNILIKMASGVMELKSHLLRHKEAISIVKGRNKRLSKPLTSLQTAATEESMDKDATDAYRHSDVKPDFTDELCMIQEPIDKFNKMLIQYNFISRQLIDFAHRVEEINKEQAINDNESNKLTSASGKNKPKSRSCLDIPRRDLKLCQQVSLKNVLKEAVQDAKEICESHYGDSPDVVYEILSDPLVSGIRKANMTAFYGSQKKSSSHLTTGSEELQSKGSGVVSSGEEGSLIYAHIVPTVHYIVVELMKNAFRATIDKHMKKNASGMITCTDMPPVKVILNARPGLEHSCICVSDQGIGIKRADMKLVMSYSFSTANNIIQHTIFNGNSIDLNTSSDSQLLSSSVDSDSDVVPMEGYGYGLPMSRAYARSFGGDLLVQSVEGYGTKVSLYLQAC